MTVEEANSGIRDAWIAGSVSFGATLITTLSYVGINLGNIALTTWLDMTITAVLTYGTYKKSRVSVIMLFIHIINMRVILPLIDDSVAIGIPFAIFFLYFIFKGIRGSIAYHKIMNNE